MDRKVISEYMTEQNRMFHKTRPDYGTFSSKWAKGIRSIVDIYGIETILDYGAGKQALKKDFPDIQSYDPGIIEISNPPKPADLVICTHVLEHIEPELFENVLNHIYELTRKVFFVTVNSGPSNKILPDGRDSNLIQEDIIWWESILKKTFIGFDVYNIDRNNFITYGTISKTGKMIKGTFLGIKHG